MTTDPSGGQNPVVSVIIPVYNGEHYLAETIESVIAQTETNWELIAVNDGSTDHSLAILEEYTRKLPGRIHVITVENGGVSRARNIAVSASRSQYVAFLDQDDIWAPEKLQRQLEMFSRHTNLGISFTNETLIDGKGAVLHENILKFSRDNRGNVFEHLIFENFIPISSVMLKKELFTKTGGFNPRYSLAEDYDFLLRATREVCVDYIDAPLLQYREHSASGTHTKIDRITAEAYSIIEDWNQKNPEIFKKHFIMSMRFRLKFFVLKIKVHVKRFFWLCRNPQ
jgi:glycosyltransferase involved in cell wall biosynthesis